MDSFERIAYLRDPAVWAEPGADLVERIVGAITEEAAPRPASHHRRYLLVGVAAAVVVAATAAGVAIGMSDHGSQSVRYQAALAGTALAPRAAGDVSLSQTKSGWRIHLHATGLARLDRGRYYEAWLKNSTGVLVPIGTFNEPNDVTLWAGVAPSAYPTLSVTRQVANGGEASSGQVVLIGATHRS